MIQQRTDGVIRRVEDDRLFARLIADQEAVRCGDAAGVL